MADTESELYRAVNNTDPNSGKLDGIAAGGTSDGLLHARTAGAVEAGSDGKSFIKGADITLEREADDRPWNVATDGGTSMHDVPGWFGYANWGYFHVPQGTTYSDDVFFIKRDKKSKWNRSKTVKGRHYTIRPKNPMTLDAYLGALDNLARAAVVASVAAGTPSKVQAPI